MSDRFESQSENPRRKIKLVKQVHRMNSAGQSPNVNETNELTRFNSGVTVYVNVYFRGPYLSRIAKP